MAVPTIYRSSDASAPVLSGTVGALEALLNAVLVTGYGSKPAAGWTRPYSGTNKGAFRAGSGLQSYLRVDDTAAQMARLVGYRAMTDVDTGSDPFPTGAQFSGGLYFRKSTSASSSAQSWLCAATDNTFYLFQGLGAGGGTNFGFGELASYVAADAYRAFIVGATDTSTTNTNSTVTREPLAYFGSAALAGHYLSGDYAQTNGSIACWKRTAGRFNQSIAGGSGGQFPGPYSGRMDFGRIAALEGSTVIRGTYPGIFSPGHRYFSASVNGIAGDVTHEGRGPMTGRSFYVLNNATSYAMLIQTAGDWAW